LVLKDVCDALEIANPSQVADRLDDDDRSMFKIGRQGEAIIINESGLYNVIIRSDKPEAKKFKKWITHEVLPSIRKHGAYFTKEKVKEFVNDPDAIITLITSFKDKIEHLQTQIEENRYKVTFANASLASNDTILIGELAKVLKSNGIDIGPNRLFEKMRQNGFLIKRSATDRNTPTQTAMNHGLFTFNRTVNIGDDGSATFSYAPRVTGKGQQYFINYFLNEKEDEDLESRGKCELKMFKPKMK
jgi:anti-repressor protein